MLRVSVINESRKASVERWCAGCSLLIAALIGVGCIQFANAQSQIVDATVHSPGLEHNLLGDPADQPVAIYLPAAYAKNSNQRFPVVYFLHGYGDMTPRLFPPRSQIGRAHV